MSPTYEKKIFFVSIGLGKKRPVKKLNPFFLLLLQVLMEFIFLDYCCQSSLSCSEKL